ncbi:MAG: hypothetical protein HN919_21365 [Verrucomicrobia bacterium]|jgi:hypothetical protein|nr:hypothetical protein [Verrucomicrobiota bacterium]
MMTRKRITNGLTVALVAMGIVGMTTGTAEAALTWEVSEAGGNVTMTTVGSLDITGLTGATSSTFSSSAEGVDRNGSGWEYINNSGGNASWYRKDMNEGAPSAVPVVSTGTFAPDSVSGDTFGQRKHDNGNFSLHWDLSEGATPGTISPISTMVFNNQTIASMFGTNLDSGPVTLWTYGATGDSILIALASTPATPGTLIYGK